MEEESNSKLPFLDVLIHRTNNRFTCSVYRKPTFSGQGLNFFSFCPRIFKINNIATLLYRAYNICSNYALLNIEFDFLRQYFYSNGYPNFIFDNVLKKFLNRKFFNDDLTHTVSKRKMYFTLPYFGTQSEHLKKDFMKLLQQYFYDTDFTIILTNPFKISSFFNYKDKLHKDMRSNIVYKYVCPRCEAQYVGCTTRNLYIRSSEHAGVSCRTGNNITNPPHSNIRNHCSTCNSSISLNNFDVIGSTNNPTDLRILESLFIHKLKPQLNNYDSSYQLLIAK